MKTPIVLLSILWICPILLIGQSPFPQKNIPPDLTPAAKIAFEYQPSSTLQFRNDTLNQVISCNLSPRPLYDIQEKYGYESELDSFKIARKVNQIDENRTYIIEQVDYTGSETSDEWQQAVKRATTPTDTLETTIVYSWNASRKTWLRSDLIQQFCFGDNNVYKQIGFTWNIFDEEWVPDDGTLVEVRYVPRESNQQEGVFDIEYDWSFSDDLRDLLQIDFSFESNENIEFILFWVYDLVEEEGDFFWTPIIQKLYELDEGNQQPIFDGFYIWDSSEEDWFPQYFREFTYNEQEFPEEEFFVGLDSDPEFPGVDTIKKVFTYTENGLVETVTTYQKNKETFEYERQDKRENGYIPNGKLIRESDYFWDTQMEDWEILSETIYRREEARKMDITEKYFRFPTRFDPFQLQEKIFSFENALASSVPEIPAEQLHIYPNPADETLFIEFTGIQPTFDLQLYDNSGRLVKSARLSGNQQTLNVDDLTAGLYIVRITAAMGVTTRKIAIH